MSDLEQFQENFITAAFKVMGENKLKNQTELADWLEVGRLSVYKIMERKQRPTMQQAITLCLKGGIDANWLLLNEGTINRVIVPDSNNSRQQKTTT